MRMLDLYCGRLGVGRVFASRGWDVVGVDLIEPPEIPRGVTFIKCNALEIDAEYIRQFDYAWASSPCEEFSVWGMKHFHPNPKWPDLGLTLFCWTRRQMQLSGIPFAMENVRPAQRFVGDADNHCGPFYLWGPAVPPLLPQGISKGMKIGGGAEAMRIKLTQGKEALRAYRREHDVLWQSSKSEARKAYTEQFATIPPELANCVADFAERLVEVKA